jgi:hypothetical protein
MLAMNPVLPGRKGRGRKKEREKKTDTKWRPRCQAFTLLLIYGAK